MANKKVKNLIGWCVVCNEFSVVITYNGAKCKKCGSGLDKHYEMVGNGNV